MEAALWESLTRPTRHMRDGGGRGGYGGAADGEWFRQRP